VDRSELGRGNPMEVIDDCLVLFPIIFPITSHKFLEQVKQKYLIPASAMLRKGIKAGVLPANCIVLRTNEDTIEILENAKKI
jgi:hypothetical protein